MLQYLLQVNFSKMYVELIFVLRKKKVQIECKIYIPKIYNAKY